MSSGQRAPGWGSYHASASGGMLEKSRVGKAPPPSLTCQECEAEGAVQLPCLHVRCRACAKKHVHGGLAPLPPSYESDA